MRSKKVYIVAGSNGAGKTTFAREFLLKQVRFAIHPHSLGISLTCIKFVPEAKKIAEVK